MAEDGLVSDSVPIPGPSRPHAVALIEMTDDDLFVYLDPAEPPEAQPLAFSEDELVQQWTGELIVCARFPDIRA